MFAQRVAQLVDLEPQRAHAGDARQRRLQHREIRRLREVIGGTALQCIDGIVDRRVARDDDHFGARRTRGVLEQLRTYAITQLLVDEHGVEELRRQRMPRTIEVGDADDFVPLVLEQLHETLAKIVVVVDDQQAEGLMGCRHEDRSVVSRLPEPDPTGTSSGRGRGRLGIRDGRRAKARKGAAAAGCS